MLRRGYAVEAALGTIDVLVPIAGVSCPQPPEVVTVADREHLTAVDLRAPFVLARRVIPGMCDCGWGRGLFMSSVGSLRGSVVGPHYAASKSGLIGLTDVALAVSPNGYVPSRGMASTAAPTHGDRIRSAARHEMWARLLPLHGPIGSKPP